ncbi:DinB family protein [Mesobacillus foraminis]|uniref:DinB family protein n=1 Tax=Mesobacillus foraminis TaxID=279826 RepID=UPI0039A229F1
MTIRPETGDYNSYYAPYVSMVPNGEIEAILIEQINETIQLLQPITETQALFRYGPDKWTIKEVIGHVTDTERIMGYRLLCIARGETVSLPGYDDNKYVRNAEFNHLSVQELLENLAGVRTSTIQLLRGLPEKAWNRKGNANDSEVTVRALAYIMAGHERHHRKILIERYLGNEKYLSL